MNHTDIPSCNHSGKLQVDCDKSVPRHSGVRRFDIHQHLQKQKVAITLTAEGQADGHSPNITVCRQLYWMKRLASWESTWSRSTVNFFLTLQEKWLVISNPCLPKLASCRSTLPEASVSKWKWRCSWQGLRMPSVVGSKQKDYQNKKRCALDIVITSTFIWHSPVWFVMLWFIKTGFSENGRVRQTIIVWLNHSWYLFSPLLTY